MGFSTNLLWHAERPSQAKPGSVMGPQQHSSVPQRDADLLPLRIAILRANSLEAKQKAEVRFCTIYCYSHELWYVLAAQRLVVWHLEWPAIKYKDLYGCACTLKRIWQLWASDTLVVTHSHTRTGGAGGCGGLTFPGRCQRWAACLPTPRRARDFRPAGSKPWMGAKFCVQHCW